MVPAGEAERGDDRAVVGGGFIFGHHLVVPVMASAGSVV